MAGYSLICCVVPIETASKTLRIAKSYGVTGGTIFLGRGSVHNRILCFLGLNEERKEIVTMVVDSQLAPAIIRGIVHDMRMHKPHHGIAFSLPVTQSIGSHMTSSPSTPVPPAPQSANAGLPASMTETAGAPQTASAPQATGAPQTASAPQATGAPQTVSPPVMLSEAARGGVVETSHKGSFDSGAWGASAQDDKVVQSLTSCTQDDRETHTAQANPTSEVRDNMYQIIYVVVERGKAEDVIDAAHAAGARGGTIINARGAGMHEVQKLFSLEIEPEKEEVFIITRAQDKDAIVESINRSLRIAEPGNGILFVMDLNEVHGLHMQD